MTGYRTGALDISLAARRIISVPTQLGCRIGCTFCVSGEGPLARNLTSPEILHLVEEALRAAPPDGRPLELSFTREGEPALNWRQAAAVCEALPGISADFDSVRYCFSGLGADRLLGKLDGGSFPTRLQLSLHAARQPVRDRLVRNSAPLPTILAAIQLHQGRFSSIELNVVLQDGVNDSDEDLAALARWGSPAWPILLNPLLRDGAEVPGRRAEYFESRLRLAGRTARRYREIGARISRGGIYPLMAARRR
ncbi:radical SAM protein [Variovorax ginsengisoli]|uniref:Radical SAM protein n=1 Tax=Variovorax ginsengisoli TaxID=363844 RepID=A0ABT8SCG5_9BURK|nr:radical SAM protein [Variovorax ginsengisoli]MDN8616532.1 radical SAM protein [Variovorax ginsengisoli]MDO1535702.1 radical SAM protein [Variovorax ginsengisoli]